MTNPFVEGMARKFEQALRLMEAALSDCPGELWETDLWPDEASTGPTRVRRAARLCAWFLGYHSLFTLDYDLTAEFEPWAPPQPFDDDTYAFPNRVFTKDELLGYLGYCRVRVRRTLEGAHGGTCQLDRCPTPIETTTCRDGVVVGGIPLHVHRPAAQIRQFLSAAGVRVQPMPGDRGFEADR